jgi:hypothetical protein
LSLARFEILERTKELKRMKTKSMNLNICRFALALPCWLATLSMVPSVTQAQEFETVERRLGEIVADGELTLEQANVMFRALREFTQHQTPARNRDVDSHHHADRMPELLKHFEQLGINGDTAERVIHTLNESGIHGEQLQRSMAALLRLIHVMRSSDQAFEMPEPMRQHFIFELEFSDEQITRVVNLAKRLSGIGRSQANADRKVSAESSENE